MSFICSRLVAVKQKLEELNKLVGTIQQSAAHIHGMETLCEPHAVGHDSGPDAKQLTNRNVDAVRSDAHVEHTVPSQKEIEREQRWER